MSGIDREDWEKFMGDFREHRGEVRAKLENLDDHLGAVSKKADTVRVELQTHAADQGAHGLNGERRAAGDIKAWLALGLSVAAAAGGWLLKAASK